MQKMTERQRGVTEGAVLFKRVASKSGASSRYYYALPDVLKTPAVEPKHE